jgi:hypothetical protein
MAAPKSKKSSPSRRKPDESARRLHPRLRVVANCDEEVNALRADLSAAVASTLAPKAALAVHSMADRDPSEAQRCQQFLSRDAVPDKEVKLKGYRKLWQQPPSNHAFVNVFVQFQRPQGGRTEKQHKAAEAKMTSRLRIASQSKLARKVGGEFLARRNFVAATIPVTMLEELKANESVAFVHPAEPLKLDLPIPAKATEPAPRAIKGAGANWKAKGVLIGIIDVGGFDFAHPDFIERKGKGTRFHSIWDQGASLRPPPTGFGYGSLIAKVHMDAAIKAADKPGGGYRHICSRPSRSRWKVRMARMLRALPRATMVCVRMR